MNWRRVILRFRQETPPINGLFLIEASKLRTTSLLRADLSFWKSEEGEQYWEEQLRALRFRQQKIERIFICDVLTDEVRELMNEHAKAGVITYIAYEADLSRDDRVDITLWGNEVLSIQRCLQKPLKIGKWYDRFSVLPDEVERAERQYRRILQVAERWDVN
jgi:hypothetical protein